MRRSFASLSRWGFAEVAGTNGRKALVVTMNSNKVNAINPEMLNDFESALSKIEGSSLPLVLTGEANNSTMCAGLDLAYLFGCDRATSRDRTFSVLSRLGVCVERLHLLPRPTVAALSGHALAGGEPKKRWTGHTDCLCLFHLLFVCFFFKKKIGAVIANSCDFRVGFRGGKAGFGAIEVPVGVPFPSWAFITT